MADRSSWLRFLPPILWEREPPSPEFSLGAALRIFEKVLTGIDDGIVIGHDTHSHDAIQAVIARLHRLYDPWHTPPEYLAWLASWVALEFPDIWDEYQRRKVTSEIVGIYQQRGLKRGIEDFLDLYTVAEKRPRVTIDDSAKLLITKPALDRIPEITALNAQVPMDRPNAIAIAPDGSLFLPDPGQNLGNDEEVWRLFPEGNYQVAGAPAFPAPIGPPPPGFNLNLPIGVTTDDLAPYNVYVLERQPSPSPAGPIVWRLTSPAFPTATVVATKGDLAGNIDPVAITHDPANGHILILARASSSGLVPPQIFDLDVSVTPPIVTITNLSQVMTALSFAVLSNGSLIIGDGRDQGTVSPGDLVLVDRTTTPWTETLVLGGLPPDENPLVSPTAVVEEAPGRVLVADVGIKPVQLPGFEKWVAKDAGLYRVDLVPASIQRAGEPKQLVWPTGLALSPDGTLFIADRGEFALMAVAGIDRDWRALHQEFGVVVYWPQGVTTTQERQRFLHDIRKIIRKEKPAHANWTFVFSA